MLAVLVVLGVIAILYGTKHKCPITGDRYFVIGALAVTAAAIVCMLAPAPGVY
jgi:hypothetical protein